MLTRFSARQLSGRKDEMWQWKVWGHTMIIIAAYEFVELNSLLSNLVKF